MHAQARIFWIFGFSYCFTSADFEDLEDCRGVCNYANPGTSAIQVRIPQLWLMIILCCKDIQAFCMFHFT